MISSWTRLWLRMTLVLVFGLGLIIPATAQGPVTVTAIGTDLPPLMVGDQGTADLTATAVGPSQPSGYGPCPVAGPHWQWTVESVQYREFPESLWQNSPGGDHVTVVQPDPDQPDATLTASFDRAGEWLITLRATATYDDPPCMDTWSGSNTC
jgi:hypothetical protein